MCGFCCLICEVFCLKFASGKQETGFFFAYVLQIIFQFLQNRVKVAMPQMWILLIIPGGFTLYYFIFHLQGIVNTRF